MRKSRQKFLDRFRQNADVSGSESVVKDVMTEEWNELRKTHSDLPSCATFLFSDKDEEIRYLNTIMEEIQSSLRAEGNFV